MIENKRINTIIIVAVVFAAAISLLMVLAGVKGENSINKSEAEYTTKIFGGDIISIEIIVDENNWKQMIDNARKEEFILADVIVNGSRFQNVGIRPKGNSSLAQVASSDSDRYSFRLQFDEYIKDQTCFGLESFVINNMFGDNTYMKEYISYDLMREIGVDAPLFGFADIKVNGENQGLYLAVELYNESYEQRVFNDTSGMLYNVKSMEMDGIHSFQGPDSNSAPGFNMPPNKYTSNHLENKDGESKNKDNSIRLKGGRDTSGGSLEYKDDKIESYSAIFNNVVGKGTGKKYQRVIQALKMLSENKDLENYFDIDKILRYLAAHTIVVNLDSYNSSMAQNYYIYEKDGIITILPWDYNLAWGGFQSGSASSVINFPIDTPLSGVEMSSRPLIEKLFANTDYLQTYHSYLQQLVDNYFANGKLEEKVNNLDEFISDYVKNDKTAYCTYEEYKKAILSFITLGNLRAASVQGQLDGTVPSTKAAQKDSAYKLIPAGDLNLSDLGSMRAGEGGAKGDPAGKVGNQSVNAFRKDMDDDTDRKLMANAMDVIQESNVEFFALALTLILSLVFAVMYKKRY